MLVGGQGSLIAGMFVVAMIVPVIRTEEEVLRRSVFLPLRVH